MNIHIISGKEFIIVEIESIIFAYHLWEFKANNAPSEKPIKILIKIEVIIIVKLIAIEINILE